MPKKPKPESKTPVEFHAEQPISFWFRPLNLDAKGFFGALAKGAYHGFSGQWTELGFDALDLGTALGIDTSDSRQLTWILVQKSILASMTDLVREALSEIADENKPNLAAVSERLDASLANERVVIDRSLFEQPAHLPLLKAIQAPFATWLESSGLEPPRASAISRRLPSYFVVALHHEWRTNAATYEPIAKAVDTPFTKAVEKERAWNAYAAQLERQVEEPMFGESFGLRQVYVPLRGFYFRESSSDPLGAGRSEKSNEAKQEQRVAVFLEEEIDQWIAAANKQDGYRVVSGGPGSGKSSFLRMYAARCARERSMRVLFIPLHQLRNFSGSLETAVGSYVRDSEMLPANPLDPDSGETRLLLLLDGLDELSMQGKIGAEAARDFVREVLKHVEIRNQNALRLLVLLSGREPVIQASESEFRERQRVLHVLPYYIEKGEAEQSVWEPGSRVLQVDQRNDWWRRYGEAAGRDYSALPTKLDRKDLNEITAQPLLNYLVALSFDRGKLDFSDQLNLNDIYRDLLIAVHKRAYEGNRSSAAGLDLDQFSTILEEIALAAWHGTGRTTTVAEIEQNCKSSGLSALLQSFTEDAKSGVIRVLTAFYFRQFGRNQAGDATFEFTHKSFREYLTARRILGALESIENEMERRSSKGGVAGWGEERALEHWTKICGPSRMDWDLWLFAEREVRRQEPQKVGAWQRRLCGLISFMLRNGMPMEMVLPRMVYREETRQARNAEEALLALLNACAKTTGELSRIAWPAPEDEGATSLGVWIKRLQGQRIGASNALALQCLSHLDFSNQTLYMVDGFGATFRSSDFHKASLSHATLARAELTGVNLSEADLDSANLRLAFLEGALLQRASLRGANLQGANLQGANLQEAHLQEAHLQGAHLQEAQLQGARLQRAHLQGADLLEANLQGADLQGANLQGADLQEAHLQEADLQKANLQAANLQGTKLTSPAQLRGTKGIFKGKPTFT